MDLDQEYNDLPGVRWSDLTAMATSPLHYAARVGGLKPDSASMSLGRLAHMATLEPERFERSVVTYPGKTRRGKQWDAFRERADADGLLVVSKAEMQGARDITQAVMSHGLAAELLAGTDVEVVCQWTIPADDNGPELAAKCKLDAVGSSHVVELKTAFNVGLDAFPRAYERYMYHGQAAFYRRGLLALGSDMGCALESGPVNYCITVESSAPYDVVVYQVMPATLAAGSELAADLIRQLKRCRTAGSWPGQAPGLVELEIPSLAYGLDIDIEGGSDD